MRHGNRNGSQSAQSSHQAPNPLEESGYSSTLGSIEPVGISSNLHRTRSSPDSNLSNANPSQENGRLKTLNDLEGIIESFRGGKSSKTETISSVIRILGENTNIAITQSQKEATFDSYLTEILTIQSSLDESRVPPSGEPPTKTTLTPGNRREHDDIVSDTESDGGHPSKRLKLIESEMPWFVPEGQTCWKPKFPRLLATGSECPNESTRRTRRNNTSLLLDAFSSASLLYMLFTLQFPLSYGLIIIFLIALLS